MADSEQRRFGIRGISAAIVMVLATLLMPLALVGFWGQRTLTDTDRFVQTVQPIVTSSVVQEDVATLVSNAVLQGVDVNKVVAQYLPPEAAPLAGPLSAALKQFVHTITLKFLESPRFQEVFLTIATNMQEAIIRVLSGDNTGAVQMQGDEIVLDLGEVVKAVQEELGKAGLTALADRPLPPAADRQIVLLDAKEVKQAKLAYAISVPIARWLIVIDILLFLGAVFLARRRLRMAGIVGACVIFGSGLLLIGLAIGQNVVGASTTRSPFALSIQVFYSTLTHYLTKSATAFLFLGVIIIAVAWMFSDQQYARALRTRLRRDDSDPPVQPPAPPVRPPAPPVPPVVPSATPYPPPPATT